MTVEYDYNTDRRLFCEKCGSLMISRRMISRTNRSRSFVEIYQCDVCRFWHHA
ncbi:MAG: hypothetical protein JW891_16420 [Candidatus Lokiarchaeota archaeon]|nr:hypothetical protein [Candidatus Lokiarchaeota archaeon]